MASSIDRALRAAEREFQAEQRYDKAEEVYRRATREFCLALAGLESTQGKGSEFSQFCERYTAAAAEGKVKRRNQRNLQKMRQAGLFTVPEHIVTAVAPAKIIVAAEKVFSRGSALTEEVALRALAESKDESSDVFGTALDIYAEQLTVLDRDEQVLPGPIRTPKPLRIVGPDEVPIEAKHDPDDAVRREARHEQFGAIIRGLEEVARDAHVARRHLQRAKSALRKQPVRPDQKDDLVLLHMEIGALLDAEAAITDAAIRDLIDGEQDQGS